MYSIKATNTSFGNVGVILTFSADSETESGYDKINIYVPIPSGNGYYTKTLSGSIGGTTLLIPTSTFYINFTSDNSVTKNGFKILPLELTTYSEGDGYKDFNTSSYTTISPTSPTTVSGINNIVETSHPYNSNISQWWFWDTQVSSNAGSTIQEYYIYRDDIQDKTVKLNSPKLDLQENAAGQLTFKMPSCNRGYNLIDRITTTFTVYRNDEEIWTGRIINIKEDFYKNKTITCEGVLAYLNDTTQPQELYSNMDIALLLTKMLAIHNNKVDKNKKFTLSQFGYDSTSSSTRTYDEVYTNYESTWNAISNKILGVSNGYFTLTRNNSNSIPNILRHRPYDDRDTCPQIIRFGKNLLDFTKDYDATQFCTVILPLGARLDDKYGISMSGIDGVSAYTTIESVNNGSMYYKNDDMVNTYGWIEQVVHWDDEENPELLLKKAKEYLEDVQYDVMTLEVKAVDLSYLDVDYSQMKLSQRVRVISEPHNLDKYFPITKISIPLDNPANTSFTLGIESVSTMSARNVKKTSELRDEIHDTSTPRISAALDDARTQASNLISSFNTGYITITQRNNGSQELYITEKQIPKNYNADNPTGTLNLDGYWRWNYKGLEFVNVKENKERGWAANTLKLALDMTGAINADQVCTGKLNANIIQAGVLQNVDYGKGVNKDVFYLNLEEGILHINAKTLSIGGKSLALSEELNSAKTNLDNSIKNINETMGSTTYAEKVLKNIAYSSLWKKLADAGEGVYAQTTNNVTHYYIKASWIQSDYMYADRILGGSLHLGGYNGRTGYLYLHNSSGTITHQLSTDGLTSFGTYTNVDYGKSGNFTIKSNSGSSVLTYMDNSIVYKNKSDGLAFAFLGVATDKKFRITNIYNDINLYSETGDINIDTYKGSLSLSSDTKIELYVGNGDIRLYGNNFYFDCNTYGDPVTVKIEDKKITFSGDIYIDHTYDTRNLYLGKISAIWYGKNNKTNLIERVDDSYNRFHGRLGSLYGGYWIIYDQNGNKHQLHIDNGLVFNDETY